ncbi:MAG: YraN family protein [Clostridia bacterium]|nr:YraN family protein [Clostridia bacterium]MBR0406950.1 YraN family protein [Clostridia bacterium]
MSSVFLTGLLGEKQAAAYLKKQGMRILHTRFRTPHGEIDLIAQEKDTLVFVEVKARPNGKAGDGLMAVNAKKRGHLRYAALYYLQSHPWEQVRFDVVEISADGLRHVKNAF